VAVSPHNYNSTSLALAATLQASATMPNFLITEYFVPLEEISRKVAPDAFVPQGGLLALPSGPGLGITVDEEFVRSQASRPASSRKFAAIHSVG
jgi:galactonate dehydratase